MKKEKKIKMICPLDGDECDPRHCNFATYTWADKWFCRELGDLR
jgi:hypothetical protein